MNPLVENQRNNTHKYFMSVSFYIYLNVFVPLPVYALQFGFSYQNIITN